MKISNDIRIHIIENNENQCEIICNKLLEFNPQYSIHKFNNGNELFKHFETNYIKNKYNYLILDYYLKTTDEKDISSGIDIVKKLNEKYSKVKIILFSVFDSEDDTNFNKLKEEPNVIECVKKSDHSYSSIQNIIRFDYAQNSLLKKKRRFQWTLSAFIAMLTLSILHFLFTFLSF